MGERFVIWPKELIVRLPIPFYLLDIRRPEKKSIRGHELHALLSQHHSCLARFDEKNDLLLLVSQWIIRLVPDKYQASPDRMSIVATFPANARAKRDFLRAAVCVRIDAGWRLLETTQAKEGFTEARAGQFGSFLSTFRAAWFKAGGGAMWKSGAEAQVADPRSAEFITTLRAYADTEHEMESEKVRATGEYLYRRVEPVGQSTYVKVPYRFQMDEVPELKEGEMLEVELKTGDKAQGQISAVQADGVLISFRSQFNYRDLPQPGTLRRTANPVQHRVRTSVLQDLENRRSRAQYLLPVAAHTHYIPLSRNELNDSNAKMNAAQRKAVELGTRTNDLLLVLGPPGTGKTTVIAEWVLWYVAQGMRVLISSKNNSAVDNVLERLMDEKKRPPGAPRLRIVRVGQEERVATAVHSALLDNQATSLQREMLSRSRVSFVPFQRALGALQTLGLRLGEFRPVLARLDDATAALHQHQEVIMAREGVQVRKRYRHLAAVQTTSRRALGWFQWLQSARIRLLIARERWRVVRWGIVPFLGAVSMSCRLTYRWLTRLQQKEEAAANAYETAWKALDAAWQSSIMLGLKQSRYEAEWRRNELEPDVTQGAAAAQSAVGAISGFTCSVLPERWTVPAVDGAISQLDPLIQRLRLLADTVTEWQNALENGRRQVLYGILMRMVDVVGATCIGINSDKRFAEVEFDVSILDESGQIQAHDAVVPLSRSPRGIMVGDHLQLPPMADPDMLARCETAGVSTDLLTKSLFEVLYRRAPASHKVLLDTQYRMPAEIADFISAEFYENKYLSGDFKRNLKPILPFFRSPVCIVDTSTEVDRAESKLDQGYENRLEAKLISELVVALHEGQVELSQIGVIAPYSKQCALVYRMLTKQYNMADPTGVLRDNVATVDSFQGQERQAILFSFTRSNPRGSIGFLNELRRLNVTMTRPQEQLILVGDMTTLSQARDAKFAAFIRSMVQMVKQRGDYVTAAEMRRRLGDGRF